MRLEGREIAVANQYSSVKCSPYNGDDLDKFIDFAHCEPQTASGPGKNGPNSSLGPPCWRVRNQSS